MKHHILLSVFIVLLLCSCHRDKAASTPPTGITAAMAFEGVNNYCHSAYDWSVAQENPSMMSVAMGDSTATEYQVVFRSYTGALVTFHVDKASGRTRLVEHVPVLDIDTITGTINLWDYLNKDNR